ncbi:MAG: hypothetical protein WB869_17910 [Candidatus Acidiferrales bacterium]
MTRHVLVSTLGIKEQNDAARVGLCGRCVFAKKITSNRGSNFYLCRRSETDPGYPKYPPLPVIACPGFEAETASTS